MGTPVRHQVLSEVFRRNDQVVLREIAEEILLVPVRGRLAQLQRLFVLNPVAHFIWQNIDGSRSLETIHHSVVEAFDVTPEEARADLLELVESLHQAELIHRMEAQHAP